VTKRWSYVLTLLRTLKDNGQAFFLIESSILFSEEGKRFLSDLAFEKYFLNSAFEFPKRSLYPEINFRPIIIHFERQNQNELFIGEITSDFALLLESFNSRTSTNNLATGILVARDKFKSFSYFRIKNEIDNLKSQYKEFNKFKLKDLALEINLAHKTSRDKPNSIYIPKFGTSPIVSDISTTTIKHQHLFQIVLNSNIVNSEYLVLFFHSELGKQILKFLISDSFNQRIDKSDIENCLVPIPDLIEQKIIILANQKLSELQATINELKTEISLNPKNASELLDKFENIQGPLKQLSSEEKILKLIRKGENQHIEFKETFSKNIKTGAKVHDKDIEKSSLKTIVAFLNSYDGGTLLIGIADNGEIKGIEIEEDVFPSNDKNKFADKYKLYFTNKIKEKIGLHFLSFIEYELFKVNNHQVLRVECKPSSEPCFYEDREFFVRANPATNKLEGKKQITYIQERFKR
jgi:hypothetical protein